MVMRAAPLAALLIVNNCQAGERSDRRGRDGPGHEVLIKLIRRLFMSNEILEQSSLLQLWVKQATERGIAQGVQQGVRSDAAIGAADVERLQCRAGARRSQVKMNGLCCCAKDSRRGRQRI